MILVKFHYRGVKGEKGSSFYMRADQIRSIDRDPQNILQTVVCTFIQTQDAQGRQGPMMLAVHEGLDEAAALVNEAVLSLRQKV